MKTEVFREFSREEREQTMKKGLTLMEEQFCQLVALGKTAREAYSEAFSVAITDSRRAHAVDNRASRLQKRADIQLRISEAAGEQKRRDRKMWEERGDDLANRIFARVIQADERGDLLSKEALRGVEVLAKLKGLNAPDETVLKDGGKADDYVPHGIEAMSTEDLKKIADDGAIDVECVETERASDDD